MLLKKRAVVDGTLLHQLGRFYYQFLQRVFIVNSLSILDRRWISSKILELLSLLWL